MNFNESLQKLVDAAILEDVGPGDYSTISCIPVTQKGKAILHIKEGGVLAGVAIAQQIFSKLEPTCLFIPHKKDGDSMMPGETAFEIEASVHTILKGERLVLNCMQRMSGIATLTKTYTEKLQGYHTQLLDTRKTTPNFRLLEKEAVRIGGGMNHRFGLYDMMMLKDNHIDYCGDIIKAIDKAYSFSAKMPYPLKIEVETRSIQDVALVCEHAKGKVFRIMLDNFTPAHINAAMRIIDHQFETEASGGINLDNIIPYAKTGVDFISVGGLIHQARSLDLSLKATLH